MDEFPSQSHKTREPKEVQPITRNPGRIRKAPPGRRLFHTMFQGDARGAWADALWESFFPNLRDNIEDAVHNGISSLFSGTSSNFHSGRRPGGGYRNNSNISKHNPDRALGGTRQTEQRISREDRNRQDTSVIEIESRAEAEEILAALNQSIDQFDVVSLAEFYQMVRITPDHTDYKFGWEDLGGAKIVHSRGSYYLDLPPVITLR